MADWCHQTELPLYVGGTAPLCSVCLATLIVSRFSALSSAGEEGDTV